MSSKNKLSEQDICRIYITPAINNANWNLRTQVREQATFIDGKILVQGDR